MLPHLRTHTLYFIFNQRRRHKFERRYPMNLLFVRKFSKAFFQSFMGWYLINQGWRNIFVGPQEESIYFMSWFTRQISKKKKNISLKKTLWSTSCSYIFFGSNLSIFLYLKLAHIFFVMTILKEQEFYYFYLRPLPRMSKRN